VNGAVVTNPAAYAEGWKSQFAPTGLLPATSPSGTWFRSATADGMAKKLTALRFVGSAYLDDLVVTAADPFAQALASFWLSVATYQLSLNSVTTTGSNLVIVVRRQVSGLLSPDGMHGTLTLQDEPDLKAGFTNVAGTALSGAAAFDGSGSRTYTNAASRPAGFYRAIVY